MEQGGNARLRVTIRLFILILVALMFPGCQVAQSTSPINVGLIAPLSGPLGPSGQAIQRGLLLAIDEVNEKGGVLGRELNLVVRDVPNDPEAGVTALRELKDEHDIVAVFGGIFSPVMLGQIDAIHELEIPLIDPWGSVSEITENGRQPNYAFRVSVSDRSADEFLVRYAATVLGAKRPGIIADTTAWGESNVRGFQQWTQRLGLEVAGVQRFDQDDSVMTAQLALLEERGADALLLIANAPEGAAIVRGMRTLNWSVPIVSHWGITGGQFVELAGSMNTGQVFTIQTYSFFGDVTAEGRRVAEAYHARFGTTRLEEIAAPVGVAHAYDGLHLLARAIEAAGETKGARIQKALETLEPYDGLVKRYAPAFTSFSHDALDAQDYIMAVWEGAKLVPAPVPRLSSPPLSR